MIRKKRWILGYEIFRKGRLDNIPIWGLLEAVEINYMGSSSQNGLHIFRFYTYKKNLVSFRDYLHHSSLGIKGLGYVDHLGWKLPVTNNWHLFSLFTSQEFVILDNIQIHNIQLKNKIFKYANYPSLVHNEFFSHYYTILDIQKSSKFNESRINYIKLYPSEEIANQALLALQEILIEFQMRHSGCIIDWFFYDSYFNGNYKYIQIKNSQQFVSHLTYVDYEKIFEKTGLTLRDVQETLDKVKEGKDIYNKSLKHYKF